MPTLTLKLTPPRSPAQQASLAAALTRLAAELLGKREAVTAVQVEALPAQQWFVGGRAVEGAAAQLEISITAGTNSESQKAAFVAAAFAELERQWAPGGRLEPASYVIVRELPATDWGYAGMTQADRRQRAAAAA